MPSTHLQGPNLTSYARPQSFTPSGMPVRPGALLISDNSGGRSCLQAYGPVSGRTAQSAGVRPRYWAGNALCEALDGALVPRIAALDSRPRGLAFEQLAKTLAVR